MKSVSEAVAFLTQLALMVILGALAVTTLRGCPGVVILSDPVRPKMALRAETAEPPLLVADQDRALLSRLLPHIRQAAAEQIKAEFKKVADDLEATDPERGHPLGGFGTTLGAAIAWLVQKVVRAILLAVLVTFLVGLFWSYWYYPAAFVACWTALFAFLTKLIARSEARKAVAESIKPAAPQPQVTRLDGR